MAAIDDSYKSLRFFERERERGDSVLVKHTGLSSAVQRVILLDVQGLPTISLLQTFLKGRSC